MMLDEQNKKEQCKKGAPGQESGGNITRMRGGYPYQEDLNRMASPHEKIPRYWLYKQAILCG